MKSKQADLLLYILKCLIGTTIGFYIYRLYPTVGSWSLISIILVLAPDRKDALNLAINRIKANLVGAVIGLTLFYIHPINLLMICIGIALSIIFSELLGIQVAARTAAVSVLIITMHEPGKYFWNVALERAGGVVSGCVIGVIITYVFHVIVLKSKRTIHRARL
ncbi:FUSC family protein [Mucilaginibacter lacusdianchii]|uniref:FUSC family protein n=1 Tax=Mucilaginibacter lacusdianchii TaxID=2684211 RepID=UPI00131AAA21|nr:FUSC family protein [Mucilaginibacter sp. JXJ CY 39]